MGIGEERSDAVSGRGPVAWGELDAGGGFPKSLRLSHEIGTQGEEETGWSWEDGLKWRCLWDVWGRRPSAGQGYGSHGQ